MHEGEVSAHSAGPGQGSTFMIRLPLITPPRSASQEAAAVHGSPRRVLIVDDNVDGALSLAMLLRFQGHEAEAVHSGKEALDQDRVFSA